MQLVCVHEWDLVLACCNPLYSSTQTESQSAVLHARARTRNMQGNHHSAADPLLSY